MSWKLDNTISDTSLLKSVFTEFVEVVNENQRYTIGLIGLDGLILSCSDAGFINTSASNIPLNDKNIILDLVVNNVQVGSLWVKGDESLKMMSGLLVESLSTRILFEYNERLLRKKSTIDDELISYLLSEHDFNRNLVLQLIKDLNIDQHTTRIAILVVNELGFDLDEIVRLKLKDDSDEVIYSLINNKSLLIFKDIPSDLNNIDMKKYVCHYVTELQQWGLQSSTYLIGTMQNRLINYHSSFESCRWLKSRMAMTPNQIIFFIDYLDDYFVSKIPTNEVYSYIEFYIARAKTVDIDELIEIATELTAHNYNISQTAESLFLHKNTLIYKIKRYEEIFSIDIRSSFQGKILLTLITNTLVEYQKQQQVGEKI